MKKIKINYEIILLEFFPIIFFRLVISSFPVIFFRRRLNKSIQFTKDSNYRGFSIRVCLEILKGLGNFARISERDDNT